MANREFKARFINKHDIEANWQRATFIPEPGEIIVYDKDAGHDYERFKIGDGLLDINSLPFADAPVKAYVDERVNIISEAVLTVGKEIENVDAELVRLVGDTPVSEQIKTEMNTLAPAEHTHNYAGSDSVGGAANSAAKLNTNAGSVTQPVYFDNGVPVQTTHTLGASVPSDAKFTDTVYTHPDTSGNKHIPSGGASGQLLRWSADGTAVWSDDNSKIYSNATTSEDGLMSAKDKEKLDTVVGLVGDKSVSTQIDEAIMVTADTKLHIVVNSEQPSSPAPGTLWLQI